MIALLVTLLGVLLATDASAQNMPPPSPAPAAPPAAAPAASPVTASWQNGLVLQTADGHYRLQLGTVIQLDGRFSVDDPLPIVNTFTIRKARVVFAGRVARLFDYRVMPEFGNGSASLLDAYFDIRFSPALRIRTGKDKTPLGYELLQGDAALLFPERSLVSSLIPNRDIGVQVQGEVAAGRLLYAGGIFNGVPDGTSTTTEVDANSDKELAGRILLTPFRSAARPERWLGNVGVNIGASTGDQTAALPSFRTSSGQTYFAYAAAPSATTANGRRTRLSPAVFFYYKSLGAFGEYARTTQQVVRLGQAAEVTNSAWQIVGAWLLTGEAAGYGLPTPRRTFDPPAGGWGAVQIAARYAELDVDDTVFDLALASAGSNGNASQVTIAVNWYPAGPIKYYATFERTVFDGDADGARPAENLVLIRAQLAF